MTPESLLPPNRTRLETALATAGADLAALPVPLRDLWNPWQCPAGLLPWLAWAVSVDDWDANWGEDRKRQVIADSVRIHRHKGTRGAVSRALANLLGNQDFTLLEGAQGGHYDASYVYDGERFHSHAEHWAQYRLYVRQPISVAQAALIRSTLADVAPARCELLSLNFTAALNDHSGTFHYDASYTYGVA
ncbi:phage tail protein I [uncultured Pseudomonas sp.]|uniref:phage tail protein I n=1 Tax=uncultured Pseudomonas sp. TaxID=114707 RepID=UPI0025F5A55C|nr:phage tail protein I [uncultured Pseudomonas sp.]